MIQTAEKFLKSKGLGGYQQFDGVLEEFAKLHVTKALKQASEKALIFKKSNCGSFLDAGICTDSILNAYSLDNIK